MTAKPYNTYWQVLFCLLLSCGILYILPQNFWLHFYVTVSQINVDEPSIEKTDQLKKLLLPENTECVDTADKNVFFCTHKSPLKSDQNEAYITLQKNRSHGFLSQAAFSQLLESKVTQIQKLRQESVNLELKLIDLDENLSEEDLSSALNWQSTLNTLADELSFTQQRIIFFEKIVSASDQDQESASYQDKITELKNTQQKLEEDIANHRRQNVIFSDMQIQYIETQQQLSENNVKRETLIRRTTFLEQINREYAQNNKIPDPEKIQLEINNIRSITQRYSPAKLFYIFPLTFLLTGLLLQLNQNASQRNNKRNLSTDEIAQTLNAAFLGDLNSFFIKKNDAPTQNDSKT